MLNRVKVLLVAFLCISAAGPALVLPALSAHRPTFSADRPMTHHVPSLPDLVQVSPLLGAAIVVKDAGTIAAKWKTRASAAQGDYGAGVAGAGASWEANSAAAEDNYGTSVTQAVADKRYGKGVRGSAGKYQERASKVGPQRYGTGVGAGQEAYAQGMQPVLQTLASINLPARNVKGSNQERSNLVAQRLRAMKLGKAS